ncbi:MAG: single-stranded DNA-binding protein [Lachnospiraceae bacterium]|nr:single-stranded DNA-binding protein [Lachnospiraceae bacterium]MBQ8329894.1 single-stranded DNA-binding protein [Lachnospiraceae bacterium]
MNKAILMGRLTRDPEIRYTQGDNPMCIARYTLAVDRRFSRNANNDGNNADFIPCVCFGKTAEFVEKYLKKGTKMAVTGRIQTGSYTNRDGVKVYTTEVVVEDQEFAESRNASGNGNFGGNGNYNGGNSGYNSGSNNGGGSRGGNYGGKAEQAPAQDAGSSDSLDGFMNIPDGIDEELPFA